MGLELTLNSKNIVTPDFTWSMSGNLAANKNKILALYGLLDDEGKEVDDVGNKWFIGHPIRVNYDYVYDGVWQLDEAEMAAAWKSQPGFIKLRDVNGDTLLTAVDRQIIGQQDPKLIWGLTNSFSYKNFKLNIFIHGVQGITKVDEYMKDDVYESVRRNTINKNRWTPTNPTNDFYMNDKLAARMAGVNAEEEGDGIYFEDASFLRVKDISLSYDFPKRMIQKAGLERFRIFITGRNLATITKWNGLDPELDDQRNIPLQKEYVFGLNLSF